MPKQQLVDDDLLIKLSSASAEVERLTGDRPSLATLHRWVSRGLKGQKLRIQYAGGHRRTKRRWIREFFDAVTAAASGKVASRPTDESRADAAAKDLEAVGI